MTPPDPPPNPTFGGAPNASTTAAWSSNSFDSATPALPLRRQILPTPSRSRRTTQASPSPLSTMTLASSPVVVELSSEALAEINDPFILLNSGIEILRMYITLDELPLNFLTAIHATPQTLREVHFCIQSDLRNAVLDVSESLGLERALRSLTRSWTGSALVFNFFRAGLADDADHECFGNFQAAEFMTAVEGITEGTVEFTEILYRAEGRTASMPRITATQRADGDGDVDMDVDL